MSTSLRRHLHLPHETKPAADLREFADHILHHLCYKHPINEQAGFMAIFSMSAELAELGYTPTEAPTIMGFMQAAGLLRIIKRHARSRRSWYVYPGDVRETHTHAMLEASWWSYDEQRRRNIAYKALLARQKSEKAQPASRPSGDKPDTSGQLAFALPPGGVGDTKFDYEDYPDVTAGETGGACVGCEVFHDHVLAANVQIAGLRSSLANLQDALSARQ